MNYEVDNRNDQNKWHFLGFGDYRGSDGRINFKSVSFTFSVKSVKLSTKAGIRRSNLTLCRIMCSKWEMNKKAFFVFRTIWNRIEFKKKISQLNALLQQNENIGLRYGWNRSFFTVNYEVDNTNDQNKWHFLYFSDYRVSEWRINFKSVSFNFPVRSLKLSFETSRRKLNRTLRKIMSWNLKMNRKQ